MARKTSAYPMDLTVEEKEALSAAAKKHGMNKKELIWSALKIAYGVETQKIKEEKNL